MIDIIKFKIITIPVVTVILLLISIFIIGISWWGPQEFISIFSILFLILSLLIFEIFAIYIIPVIQKDSITEMEQHFLVKSIREKNIINIWLFFPLTMLFEELIFRLYIFVFLYITFGFITAIILGAFTFGLYHIHTWFEFKNKNITYSFIIISTILGIILNILMYYFGLPTCIIVHWVTVFMIFYFIERKFIA